MSVLKLIDDGYCIVCGEKNPCGLKIKFRLTDDKRLEAEYTAKKEHQGFRDILHGGIIGMILDEAMAGLLWKLGYPAVTASYEVDLKMPVFTGETLRFTAGIEAEHHKLVMLYAECRNEKNELTARARAKCVKV